MLKSSVKDTSTQSEAKQNFILSGKNPKLTGEGCHLPEMISDKVTSQLGGIEEI